MYSIMSLKVMSLTDVLRTVLREKSLPVGDAPYTCYFLIRYNRLIKRRNFIFVLIVNNDL